MYREPRMLPHEQLPSATQQRINCLIGIRRSGRYVSDIVLIEYCPIHCAECYLSPLGHLISSLMSSTKCRWACVGKRGKAGGGYWGDKRDDGGGVEE